MILPDITTAKTTDELLDMVEVVLSEHNLDERLPWGKLAGDRSVKERDKLDGRSDLAEFLESADKRWYDLDVPQ